MKETTVIRVSKKIMRSGRENKMKEQDFFDLKIGQKIYYQDIERKVILLYVNHYDLHNKICFDHAGDTSLNWDDICKDCSLEAPKPKRKLYRHILEYNGHSVYDKTICSEHFETFESLQSKGFYPEYTLIETQIIWEEK